jgi:hypothetical protein
MVMNLRFKHIGLSALIFLFAHVAIGQTSISIEFSQPISTMAVDANGNMFVADHANTLYKLDENGKIITNVNVKVYGQIDKIDCSNPFEIYTYHKDQNIVVYYDNMLNIRGETRLNDLYFNTVSSITRSYDNGLWIFDYSSNILKKINKLGEVEAESNNINIITGKELHVFDIIENKNWVYLCDSVNGLIQFDIYATYVSTHFISGLQGAAIEDEYTLIKKGEKVYQYNLLTRNLDETGIQLEATNNFVTRWPRVYSFYNNLILIFTAN